MFQTTGLSSTAAPATFQPAHTITRQTIDKVAHWWWAGLSESDRDDFVRAHLLSVWDAIERVTR
jgi:hypothetical protein